MVQIQNNLGDDLLKQFCETLKKLKDKCIEKSKCESGIAFITLLCVYNGFANQFTFNGLIGETPQKRRKTKDDTSDSEATTGTTSGDTHSNPDTSDSSSDGESVGAAESGCERLISTINELLEKFES
jgi:hypothetical protein